MLAPAAEGLKHRGAHMGAAVSREPTTAGTRRLKVLISAYACEPGKGSEPGVGWNLAAEAARRHDVWAITRANNRSVIDAELARNPIPSLHMVYYDLPRWSRWWKRGAPGVRLYYYIWQLALYFVARRLHRQIHFDVTHHVTFVKYWMPSLLPFLPAPFLWGPVGGGESAPRAFQVDCGWRGRLYEVVRSIVRRSCEWDPLVLATARRSALALAVTEDTAQRLRAIGVQQVEIYSEAGLSEAERTSLGTFPSPTAAEPVRFLSLGNMLHLKGFHLGLRAFAVAALPHSEYWLIGDGPYRTHLQQLARSLGIAEKVHFWGALPRAAALAKLGLCHVLVHPSLHDSGGWVCLEAMAAGKPVICLDLGGPGVQVTKATGFKTPAQAPAEAVEDMARAMAVLAWDPGLRVRMGQAGKERVASEYAWERKGEFMTAVYQRLTETTPTRRSRAR
jgi:glycosyltransferase involved in cell wall biosynthesis